VSTSEKQVKCPQVFTATESYHPPSIPPSGGKRTRKAVQKSSRLSAFKFKLKTAPTNQNVRFTVLILWALRKWIIKIIFYNFFDIDDDRPATQTPCFVTNNTKLYAPLQQRNAGNRVNKHLRCCSPSPINKTGLPPKHVFTLLSRQLCEEWSLFKQLRFSRKYFILTLLAQTFPRSARPSSSDARGWISSIATWKGELRRKVARSDRFQPHQRSRSQGTPTPHSKPFTKFTWSCWRTVRTRHPFTSNEDKARVAEWDS